MKYKSSRMTEHKLRFEGDDGGDHKITIYGECTEDFIDKLDVLTRELYNKPIFKYKSYQYYYFLVESEVYEIDGIRFKYAVNYGGQGDYEYIGRGYRPEDTTMNMVAWVGEEVEENYIHVYIL